MRFGVTAPVTVTFTVIVTGFLRAFSEVPLGLGNGSRCRDWVKWGQRLVRGVEAAVRRWGRGWLTVGITLEGED